MPGLAVRIHCPLITTLPDESPRSRAMRLIREIEAAASAKANLFVAPEYYFTYNTSGLPDTKKCIAYDDDDMIIARDLIARASEEAPKMTIVTGTMFVIQGVATQRIFNTAFVYQGGSKIAECSKFNSAGDMKYAAICGPRFYPGETGVGFDCGGVSCYLQICADATAVPESKKALSILVGYQASAGVYYGLKQFTARVVADGGGWWWIYADGKSAKGDGPNKDVTLDLG